MPNSKLTTKEYRKINGNCKRCAKTWRTTKIFSKLFIIFRHFSKVKYKQNIYHVGEYVHLYDPTETLPYVAKINSIVRIHS